MEELLLSLKPNRNTKYYDLVLTFIGIINHEIRARLRLTVEEILQEAKISRPTFYSYYEGVGEFYVDLMEVLSIIIPQYMTMKSKDLSGEEMIRFAFSMKMGVMMSNMKKISARYPEVMEPWNRYFENAVEETSKWYANSLGVDKETAALKARLVLNELILHEDIYYSDFEAYRNLTINHQPAQR